MSLVTQLTDLITRIGTEIKTMKSQYSGNNTGSLTGLNTSSKTSLLSAINEVNTLAGGKQANLGYTAENAAQKAVANGYAGLDGAGKVPIAQLPDIVNKNKGFFATAAALAMVFPTATDGDYAVVGATDTVWLWDSGTTVWVETDKKGAVTSVNNMTGAVTIPAVTTSVDGLMLATDKTLLNIHLTTHPAPTVRDARNQVAGSYEPVISTKNTAFNVNFGTATGTACQGNDARLGDARTPTAHSQTASTITDFAATVLATVLTGLSTATNAVIAATDTVLGALGKLQKQISDNLSTFNSHTTTHPVPTVRDARNQVAGSYEPLISTKLTAFNKNFGAAAGDVCQGNDGRLGDARTPTAHNQTASTISDFSTAVGLLSYTEAEIGNIATDFVAAFNTAIA